jgi:hypothetical protein
VPITSIRFGPPWDTTPAQDIHLLRGKRTGPLRGRLWVLDASTGAWDTLEAYSEAHHDQLEVSFQPVFKAAPDTTGKRLQGFEIYVDKHSGEVEAKLNPPDSSPSSFMLEAVVDDDGAGSPLVPNAFLRVHVHGGVTNLWLTPRKLAIRRVKAAGDVEPTQYRFAVRAQFDDGTVGDITESGELTFTPAPWFDGNEIKIPASAGDAVGEFDVTVKTSPNLGSKTTKAKLEILRSWAKEPDPPKAELIDGAPGVRDGSLKPERLANVLFLSSGFTSGDRDAFRAITSRVVDNMQIKEQLLQPFGHLAQSINYWRLFVPSPERGISVRAEVQQLTRQGMLFASLIPTPAPPPPAARDWQLEHVLYMAGLPVPADLTLVKDVTDPVNPHPVPSVDSLRTRQLNTLDFSALRKKWIKTMRLDHSDAMVNGIMGDWLLQWLYLCDRTFIDEVDNFTAVSTGVPPGALPPGTPPRLRDLLQPNGLRPPFNRTTEQWTGFFSRVEAAPLNGVTATLDNGRALGNLWAQDDLSFAFDNCNHVAFLCNLNFGTANAAILTLRPRQQSVYARLFVNAKPPVGDKFIMRDIPVTRDPPRNALKLDLPASDVEMLVAQTWRTFAHELAHTFGLGDEYAESSATYAGTETDLVDDGNLTAFATVLDPAAANLPPTDPAKFNVRYERIKWNWPRIRKASVLRRSLGLRPGGLYLAFVRKRADNPFAPGDTVRLRQRDPRKVLGRDPVISNVEFVVDSISPDDLDPPHDAALMTIVLKNESIGINVDQFGAGSIVYMPIAAAADAYPQETDPLHPVPMAHPYLTLVAPGGERLMNKTGSTMQGANCDNSDFSPNIGGSPQVPAAEDPKIPSKDLPRVVGVYFGGSLWACGILHPTGRCVMRDSSDEASPFCPVCQYILVDRLDPEKHSLIDQDYETKYPL